MAHWADRIAKEIISSGKYKPYWVDDMTTPSGYSHLGSIRGPIIHGLIYKVLVENGQKAKNTYVFNDFDPIDGLPPELMKDFSQYLGFPLRAAPSPVSGAKSFGEYFSDDFKKVLSEFGTEVEFLSSWDLYHQGKFDGVIKEALDSAAKIQDIYERISGSRKKEKDWLPFQVICENCGKLGTTRVYKWDGEKVSYRCEPDLVTWARGCGHEGKTSPFGGTGKLPWKVDWPAHWKVIGVTIEGAGKDHASAGGSYDIAMELCKEVFKYPHPYKFAYEFFLIGGRKMSSSKGLGFKAHDITKILPAEVARFLFAKGDYKEQISFDPVNSMAISDLFDEYDKAAVAFWSSSDPNLARTFELAQTQGEPPKEMFLPRFREVAQIIQMPNTNVGRYFEQKKGKKLAREEKRILEERIQYAKVWLAGYAPEEAEFNFKEILSKEDIEILSEEQKRYLRELIHLIKVAKSAKELERKMYELAQSEKIPPAKAFEAVCLAVLGKTHGPKAAWFLLSYPKEKIIKRLREISS